MFHIFSWLCGHTHYIVHLLGDLSISNCHLSPTPQIWVGVHDHLSSPYWDFMSWDCLDLCTCYHNLCSYVQLLYCIHKPMILLFSCVHPPLMGLTNFWFYLLNDLGLWENDCMRCKFHLQIIIPQCPTLCYLSLSFIF